MSSGNQRERLGLTGSKKGCDHGPGGTRVIPIPLAPHRVQVRVLLITPAKLHQ
jgi:hypothetical protein